MKKTLLIMSALLLTAWGGGVRAQDESAYKFVCSDWGSMDLNRLTDENVTHDETNNTITVNVTGDNNVALGNGREAPYKTANYTITNEQHWFIVVGTNLSNAEGASKLWWMNGANNGGEYAPTNVVELSDGQILFAWDLTTTGIDTNLLNDVNYLDGWTGFGLTSTTGTSVISNICFYTLAEAVEAYPSLEGVLQDATPYEFVNTDWVVLTDHAERANATANNGNTITITVTDTTTPTTAMGLCNGNTAPYNTDDYYVTNEQCWFVIVGTNLSTAEDASILWWMNGYNEGMTISPTETATLDDGQIALAWDMSQSVAGTYLQGEKNTLNGFTCFGLTSTSTTTVISDINYYTFDEMVEEYPELDQRTPYEFVNEDWVVLSDHSERASATTNNDNTITITVTDTTTPTTAMGLCNGNTAPYNTANYYVTNEQCWFIVVGTNLSTAEDASELWWMDGANWGTWAPTQVVALDEEQVLVAWDLSTMTEIDVNLQNEKNTLSGWTCFGLTSTTGTSVISDIGFYTENEAHSMIDGTSHFCTANESHWSTTATLKDNEHLRVDTWATQSDEIMSTPFMEYYADGDAYLSDATISHEQLTGLTPGMYTVSMDIRIIDYAQDETGDNNAKIGTGTTFNANNVSEDLLTGNDGTEDDYDTDGHDEVYGTYSLNCEVGEAGTLDINLDVKDATYSWIMWKNLTVTYAGEVTTTEITWEMTEAKWGTLILPFDAAVPSGLTAYAGDALTIDGSTITVGTAATSIAANTPYLVSGTEEEYTFTGVATNTQDTYSAGVLTGTFKEMDYSALSAVGSTVYLLQNHDSEADNVTYGDDNSGVGFYPVNTSSENTGVTLGAYHCYLTSDIALTALRLPGMATGVEAVEGTEVADDAIYDLSGRRVAKAVKGVYIQNGKKVLVK